MEKVGSCIKSCGRACHTSLCTHHGLAGGSLQVQRHMVDALI